MTRLTIGLLCICATGCCPGITLERIVTGLEDPVYVTSPDGDANTLYILERAGIIQALDRTSGDMYEFLNIVPLVESGGTEQGLVGLAFHPDFQSNGRFFIYYTAPDGAEGTSTIAEYRVVGGDGGGGSNAPVREQDILSFAQPQATHNAGWMDFGPDGYLYIASGDGGGANDIGDGHTPEIGNAQDITDNLLGKMLRIDIDADDFPDDDSRNYRIPPTNPFVNQEGDDEIWAYGLRNPWRCSFDRETGDLYIADVGQGAREEINFQAATVEPEVGAQGDPPTFVAANYGWNPREGTVPTPGVGGPPPDGNVEPLYDYERGFSPFEGLCVTGGYVYRGEIEAIQGEYFLADFVSRQTWSFRHDGTAVTSRTNWTSNFDGHRVSSFGEASDGSLFVIDYDGQIYEIVEGLVFCWDELLR